MAFADDTPDLTPHELAELSALADGTLDPDRRAEVRARIAASPELTALYERERQVVALLHEARARDRAPAALRARIEAQRPSRPRRATARLRYGGALAGALAAVALALVLILPAGSPGSPSVSQAAAIAVRPPTGAAPAPDPSAPLVQLDLNTEDVYFPNWTLRFRLAAYGQRQDQLSGHDAKTVYYGGSGGDRVVYTIVSSPALRVPRGASISWVRDVRFWTMTQGARVVVTWLRSGRTCVLSSATLTAQQLQVLATWEPQTHDAS
jgi:hypothetical protein